LNIRKGGEEMLKKIYSAIMFALGGLIGGIIYYAIVNIFDSRDRSGDNFIQNNTDMSVLVLSVIVFGLIFYVFAPDIVKTGKKTTLKLGKDLEDVPLNEIVAGTVGVISGLIIALLISLTYRQVVSSGWYTVLTILLYILCGFIGFTIAVAKYNDIAIPDAVMERLKLKGSDKVQPKVVDTSVIIDGRIVDIMRAGFIEGTLIVPEFVLDELRHIADSSDSLKRARGRRGLEILDQMQKEFSVEVYSASKTRQFDDIPEVDVKLIKLAEQIGGKLLTTDYNLNKVATIHDIKVMNINDLANAIKPIVIPGEKMIVDIVKQGKDPSQGIGYLDDGTMIVVEDGSGKIGESVTITVTSIIQTSAGKMIFGRMNAKNIRSSRRRQ
jgi:uncharacterized protein YacL